MGKKGIFSPFTIATSLVTGGLFPLLGSVAAVSTGALESLYLQRLILVVLGGFLAHWLLTHTIHDLLHYEEDDTEGILVGARLGGTAEGLFGRDVGRCAFNFFNTIKTARYFFG